MALTEFSTRRVHLTLVDIVHACFSGEARQANTLEIVDQVNALAVRSTRRRLALVYLELTVGAREAELTLTPVAGRLGVIELVVDEQVERGCCSVVDSSCCRFASRGRGLLEALEKGILVRVLPALAVQAWRGLALVYVDLAVFALVALLTRAAKLVYTVEARGVVEAPDAKAIVYVDLAVAARVARSAAIAFVT